MLISMMTVAGFSILDNKMVSRGYPSSFTGEEMMMKI